MGSSLRERRVSKADPARGSQRLPLPPRPFLVAARSADSSSCNPTGFCGLRCFSRSPGGDEFWAKIPFCLPAVSKAHIALALASWTPSPWDSAVMLLFPFGKQHLQTWNLPKSFLIIKNSYIFARHTDSWAQPSPPKWYLRMGPRNLLRDSYNHSHRDPLPARSGPGRFPDSGGPFYCHCLPLPIWC